MPLGEQVGQEPEAVDSEVKILVHILQPKPSLSRPQKPQNDAPLDR
jgi:hypothetical protein